MNHHKHRESRIENAESSIQNRVSRIEYPESRFQHRESNFSSLLAGRQDFRHFSPLFTLSYLYICRESSTNHLLFMQNKPNFLRSQMNVILYNTTDYENNTNWTIGQNKPNANPIKPNFQKAKMNANDFITKDYRKKMISQSEKTNPIQTQFPKGQK